MMVQFPNTITVVRQQEIIQQRYGKTGLAVRLSFFKYAATGAGLLNWVFQKIVGTTPPLDLARLEATKQHFVTLGAKISEIEAIEARIPAFFLHANELQKKIENLGGFWQKATINNQPVFAIYGPIDTTDTTPAWQALYNSLKILFNEETQDAQGRSCLITARDVTNEIATRHDTCIFFANISEPWQLRKKRLAHFLGRGFSIASYNGRGLSDQNAVASIEGSYNDADAAYQHITPHFKQVYVYGNCKDSFAALYTAKKNSENVILETPPRSLLDAIGHHVPNFIQKTAIASLGALNAAAGSSLQAFCPDSSKGNLEGILEEFSQTKKAHKIIFLANQSDNDSPLDEIQTVAEKAKQDLNSQVATIVVDSSKYPGVKPHHIQSWADQEALKQLEALMGYT